MHRNQTSTAIPHCALASLLGQDAHKVHQAGRYDLLVNLDTGRRILIKVFEGG